MNSKTDQNKMLDKKKYLAIVPKVMSWKFYWGITFFFIFFIQLMWQFYMFSRRCWWSHSNPTILSKYGDRKHKYWGFPRYCCQNMFTVILWTQCIHHKLYLTDYFFLISDKSSTIPLIWVSAVLILMLLILVIYSIIQQRRYVYFIQLIFYVIHSLVHIFFPIV